jgi:signal peptidase I
LNNPFPPKSIIKDPLQPPNLFYRGSSMKGTFKPGNKLIMEIVPFDKIKKGDVIIFRRIQEEHSDFIVHRVAEIICKRLITRGDNCFDQDKEPIKEENVIGRVIRYDWNGKIRLVRNGGIGRMRAALLHGRLHAVKGLKFFLRKPYVTLRRTGLLAKLWHPDIEGVQFEAPDGPFVKYLHKGKSVAISLGNKKFCLVKRPFDFFF